MVESVVVLSADALPLQETTAVPPEAEGARLVLVQDERPNGGTMTVMAVGGMLAASAFATGGLVSDNEGLFWLTPLVGGATTYALGEVMGHRGSPLRSLGMTALGAVPGAAILALYAATTEDQPLADLGTDDVLIVLSGMALYSVLPPALAARAHYVSPAVHTTPDGQSAPALSVRIGL